MLKMQTMPYSNKEIFTQNIKPKPDSPYYNSVLSYAHVLIIPRIIDTNLWI